MDSQYELADELSSIDGVDDVQVSKRQIVIAHAPSQKGVENIPERIAYEIEAVIDDTDWVPETGDVRDVERHRWGHGRADPILSSSDHEVNYELQVKLAKSRF